MSALPFRPLALPAGANRRRLNVFSPKLTRRLSLASYDVWRCWLALKANPAVLSFCERPTRMSGSGSATLDFWVQLRDKPAGEFWLIVDDPDVDDSKQTAATPPSQVCGLPLRTITQELLLALAIPLRPPTRRHSGLVRWLSTFTVMDQVEHGEQVFELLALEEDRVFRHTTALVQGMQRRAARHSEQRIPLLPELMNVRGL